MSDKGISTLSKNKLLPQNFNREKILLIEEVSCDEIIYNNQQIKMRLKINKTISIVN